jgi:hypothetical protein
VTGNRVREHFRPADYGKFLKGVRDNPELAGSGGTPTLHRRAKPRRCSAARCTRLSRDRRRPRTSAVRAPRTRRGLAEHPASPVFASARVEN